MPELSCDTPFIGQIETHDLIRNQMMDDGVVVALVTVTVTVTVARRARTQSGQRPAAPPIAQSALLAAPRASSRLRCSPQQSQSK